MKIPCCKCSKKLDRVRHNKYAICFECKQVDLKAYRRQLTIKNSLKKLIIKSK